MIRFLLVVFITILGLRVYKDLPYFVEMESKNKELERYKEYTDRLLDDVMNPPPVDSWVYCKTKEGNEYIGTVLVSTNYYGERFVFISPVYRKGPFPKGLPNCKEVVYIINGDNERYATEVVDAKERYGFK